jgi:hypothetical protein
MADTKISALGAADAGALGTMVIVQGGTTKKLAATAVGVVLLAAANEAAQRTALDVYAKGEAATFAQGALAASATQPGDLATTLNASATDKLLGRVTAGAGAVEEIACTAAGRALLDDATAADQRNTLSVDAAKVTGGAADTVGTAVLVAGTVEVATTAVAAGSIILISRLVTGGTEGHLKVGTITAGTKFVISSSDNADTSTIAWMIAK